MTNSASSLQKLILDSQALSIWDHKTGPVFWYAANVPGPFYLNTEHMIGRALAETLLEGITAIVADHSEGGVRADKLDALILDAYRATPAYQTVIQALMETAQRAFPRGSYEVISGGERRDWLFSIPVAAELNMPHLYLFKNKKRFSRGALPTKGKALHISDLINNAASYFDMWLPMLADADLTCAGTLTVNTRGIAGVTKLEQAGYKVAAINKVDTHFFRQLAAAGLISEDTLREITLYFTSSAEWAGRYLMQDAKLFDIAPHDKKSFERMKAFFHNDPWQLKARHPQFFATMLQTIAERHEA